MSDNTGKQGKKQVLSDHKRVGKRFIPPLLQVAPFHDLSWVNCTLPELLWLGLLNNRYGLKRGSDLGLSLAKAAAEANVHSIGRWYAPTSAYSLLTEQQKIAVLDALKSTGDLAPLKSALASLVVLYPECPFVFLFEAELPIIADNQQVLTEFKTFLTTFFNKYDPPGTLAQANAIYIAFVTGILKVVEGVSLSNFPAVADYPQTDESRQVGASVHASISAFFSFFLEENSYEKHTPWSRYFWNRGLELEPCAFEGADAE